MNRTLSIVVHGESGVGKSWFGDTTPAPRLVLDAEGGSRFTPSRKIAWDGMSAPPAYDGTWDTCVVTTRNFQQVSQVYQWLVSGQHQFRSVVLDSLTEIQKRCYTPDTEVLTRVGWVRLDELGHETVAQWHPDGRIEFVHPTDYQTLPYDGELVSLPSVSSALLVTPDHRQPTMTQAGTFEVREARDVRRGLRLPVSGVRPGDGGPTEAEARLLAAYQADGTDPGHNRVYWTFSKARKIARLRELLDAVDAVYKVVEYEDGTTRFSVERPTCLSEMPRKRWEWRHLDWHEDARRAALEELPYWDGNSGVAPSRVEYTTADRDQADVVCAMGALTGYGAAVRSVAAGHVVKLTRRAWRRLDRVARVPYVGEVRCLSVPSGFLLTRREGKVTVSGNCLDDISGIDQPTQQDWGALLRRMESLTRQFRDLTMHPTRPLESVVLICLTSEKQSRFRPHVQGQLGITLPYFMDVVGYLFVQPDESGALVRKLLVQPSGQFDAKDRTNRLGIVVVDPNVERMLDQVYGPTQQPPLDSNPAPAA